MKQATGRRGSGLDARGALDRAILWHVSSPIRVTEPASPARGAILHGIDGRSGSPMGVYTEITGYAVSLFVFLARRRHDDRFLEIARDAGEFLLRIQTEGGAYPDDPHPFEPASPRRSFSFDTAMCIVGMTRLARATSRERFAESALAAGRWLLGMQRADGSFDAMEDSRRGRSNPGGFFGDGSCIHAKNAIALLELHALAGDRSLLDAAVRACDYTLGLQDDDGSFWSTPEKEEVFTHAHAYACEGLLFAGHVLGEPRYVGAAGRGVEWLVRSQTGSGGWSTRSKTAGWSGRSLTETLMPAHPSDAAAQAARLLALAGGDREEPRRRAEEFLLGNQAPDGAVAHCRRRLFRCRLSYTWCTQFAIQAWEWGSGPAIVSDLF